MAHHKIEYKAVCTACKGTGLYVGMGERDGAAVVCRRCDGRGCAHVVVEYDDFAKRVSREDVVRVLECNPGVCVGAGKDGQYQLSDFGGMSFEEWAIGKPFTVGMEMRKFVCPAWWYQTADYKRKPDWRDCLGCGTFSSCKHFGEKETCWERWDKQYGTA